MMDGMEHGRMMVGFLNQQAIHHVDVLNWLFGPIHSVFAKSTRD